MIHNTNSVFTGLGFDQVRDIRPSTIRPDIWLNMKPDTEYYNRIYQRPDIRSIPSSYKIHELTMLKKQSCFVYFVSMLNIMQILRKYPPYCLKGEICKEHECLY